ncbi:hypothetical protein PF008_g3275, partial [Phytophthora fragariae]
MCMLAQELDAEDVVSAVVQLQRIARVDLALVSAPPAQCPAHARSSTQWTDECPVLRDLAATGRHSTDAVGSRPRVIGLIRQGACPSQREQQDPSMRPSSSQQLGVGDCVSVKPKPSDSGGAKRLGRVQRLRSSGAVDVFYADGRVEERVGRDRLAPSSSKTRPTRRDGPRPRAGHEDELEEKAPAPAAAEAPRRARTETATAAAPTRRRQPTETSPHTARASQQKQPASSRRPRDSSDSVAYTHKQVTEIMDAITAADADAVAVKNSLSLLLRVIRTAPRVTAECLHEQNGELRLLATIRMHSAHAVLLCYGCVLMRKLCHLSVEAAELFVQHGIVTTVAQALQSFPEDAILQASACGCLAVLTQTSDVSKHEMLSMSEPSILDLVLASLDTHREYSNLTRQVQIYACEVLTELCDYGGPPTVGALIAHDPRRKTESPMELAVALTRQSMAREDKKVTCSFCSLLLCLASNSSAAAESLREFGAIPDISVVMAKYPVDEGIIRFSAAALREIAETSLSHSPSKTVHEKARVILDEDVSPQRMSSTPALSTKRDRSQLARGATSSRSRDTSPRATGRKGESGLKSTSRRRPKSPTSRPSTSSGIPAPENTRSFGQLSHALGEAPSASFFASPVKLADDPRATTAKASRLPPPRSRDEHIRRAGEMKRRNNGTGQRDRLLMKTYGNAPLGPKTHRTGTSSDAQTDRGFSRENSSSRFSPLKNNYLGAEGVTFVIPPPLSSSQSMEQPAVSRGTKTPSRPHSARLTPLVNERVKISSARFPNSVANASEWGSGDDEWPMDTSMSTGHLRPQTAVVVTKLSDPTSRWDLPSDRAAGYKKNDRGGSRERKRERDSPIGVTNKRHSPGERPRSPPSSRMKGPSLSRSNSVIPDEDAVSDGRYGEAASGPPPRVSSDVMDMDQSMAELREFAQQLLKEEARISSLLAQTGSKSPGLNRMSFSDKLHKMIEIAESSMYERSLALSGSQGWADAATRTPPKTAEATPDDHAERPTSAARDVAKPTLDGAKASSSRKTPAVADAKIPASDAHTTPKMLSGYKKSRASTVGQKKQHKAHAKLGGVSPKADRKVVSKLDPNVRTPSIPFLEPLQVDSEKAPAKQDMEPSPQEERTKFSLTADTLSAMEDSPLKKEDRDTICEESIQEDIPVTASPLDIPSNLEEKEDEPVPEHIDVKHEEDGYHDEDASRSVHSLHDVEESPIIEEIGFASPQRNDVDSGRALANISQPLVSAQDDSYEDDQHTFEPEVSFVELVAPETIPADNLLQESKLTEEAFNAERTMTDSDVEAKGGAEFENFTVPAFLSDNEHRAASFDPDVRAPVSEETTADELVTPKVADETHDMWDRKSEEDEVGGPLHPSEVEPSYCPVSEQTSKDAEIDGFEFIELPARNQNDLATLLDWSTARDTCQEIVNQGIADALVEVEAMGGVYILLPREDTVSIDLTLGDNVDDSDVLSAAKNPADNNDDIVGIESRDVYSEEKTGDAPTIAASDAALLSALQNVVSSLTPSTVLAQEILSSTFEQLTERESISREIQDDAFRIQQAPSDAVAGEIGRIVASTIAGSLNSAVEQLRSLPLDADGSAEFSQSLNELVAVAVEAVAQRIRANDDLLVVPPVERFLPATTTPVPSLALSPSNNNDSELSHRSNTSRIDNDEQSSNHSDTSRTDEGHVSVQMAKAIQDSVNGIIAMSLVSMMEQFELSKLGQDGKDPESEGDDEAVATKQVEKDPSHINEPVLREENDAILPAKAAIAVGSYVNGLIALSVQNSVERALENGSPVGGLSELTVMAVNLHDAPREEHTLLDADTRKTDTSRSKGQKSITEPVETTPQENNAEEELSVQTVIAISRSIDGIIALSLEKTVKQLCLVDTSRADPEFDDSNEGISTFSLVDDTHEVPILPTHTDQVVDAEHAISEDVSLAIRRNISAVVAVALESVLQRLQGASDQLEQQTKEEGGQASTRIVEPHDLQPALPDDDLAGPREDGTEGIEQAPQQNFWGQDDATTELQDLPVAMAISIQRSVNAILMQALENVITDLTRESGMDKPGEDGELHSKPDEYNDTRDVETIPYDHAAVMTAIETFDQLHLPGDGDNQTSDRDAKGISIQMAIAVRWTVSGMIALAVENAIADTMLYSAAVDTPAEESPSDNYREPAPVADDIAKVISSDMAVAIRQTVDGIIERTTENVMSQIGAHTVQELVSQLVETTASLGELSLGGSAGDAVLTARKWAAPDQVSEEDESTLPIQMSLAIRQAVNGLIGLSLQAALEDAMGKTPAQLLLDPERDGSGEAVDSNLMEETRALSGSAQRSPTSVPLLNLPLASARTQLSDEKVEPSEEDQESVSVAAALAVSRTVTAVIAAGVEKMLDSMVNMGASLVAGQDTALASLTKTFSHDEHEHLTVDTGLKGTVSSSPEAVQDNEDNTQEETSGAQLSVRIPEGSEHAVNDGAYHHGAYEESLSPAMSVAVALSVRAILMEAVDKVSQRVTLPRAYKDDIEFVKAEVLETPQLENTADHLGYYRSLAHESDAVATALASVVNTMTAATLASISSTSEVHQDVVAAEADTKSQQEADPEVHDTMYQILHPISEARETPTHSITEPDELHTTSGKVFEAPEATVEEPQESSASASEDVVAATAAAAASIAVVSALSETVDAVEAESEYADDEFGDEQVTESVPEVTTDAAEEVAATEPAEVAATGEPSEVAAAVAEAVAAVSEAASEAEVAAAAEDLVSAVESAVRAAAEQQAVGETPVAA